MKNNIKKNFIWNSFGSTFNAFTSLFFMLIVVRLNGVNDAGVFTFAFSTACLLQVFGIYAGRVYQITENNSKISDGDFIYNRLLSSILMILCAIIFIFYRKYDLFKMILILLLVTYKAVEAFSESIYGIIQKNNDLYKVGISLFLKGFVGVILFFIINIITNNIIISSASLIFSQIFILFVYDFQILKEYKYKKNEFNIKNVISIFKSGFFVFLFTFLTQYIINAQKYAIDGSLSNELQTIFGIILMPATVMILCGQFMIHPFLLKMSNDLNNKRIKEFTITVLKIMLAILLLGVFFTMVSYVIGIPFLELLYGIDLDKYLYALVIIIMGATLFGISFIISNALTTMRKTKIQALIYVIVAIATCFLSKYFVLKYEILGAAYAYFASMLLLLLLYCIIFFKEIKKMKVEVEHS